MIIIGLEDLENYILEEIKCKRCGRDFYPYIVEGEFQVPEKCPFRDCRLDWRISKGQAKRKFKKTQSILMTIRQKESKLRGYTSISEEVKGNG